MVFGKELEFQGVEEGYEVLGGFEDECALDVGGGTGGGVVRDVCALGVRRAGGRLSDCGGKPGLDELGCSWNDHLVQELACVSLGIRGKIIRTSHSYLNVSRSTNFFATVSSLMIALYCFSNLSHVSVYSASGMASFLCAFSNSSSVIIMLKTSASESWRSRSDLLEASFTS